MLSSYTEYDGYTVKYHYAATGILLGKETNGSEKRATLEQLSDGAAQAENVISEKHSISYVYDMLPENPKLLAVKSGKTYAKEEYQNFWYREDRYFDGKWWQDSSKMDMAYQMLLSELKQNRKNRFWIWRWGMSTGNCILWMNWSIPAQNPGI